jgi:DNA-binding transcriptional regulator YiaG
MKRPKPRRRPATKLQAPLFEYAEGNERGKALVVALELYLDEHPAWAEGMDYLISLGVQPDDAMLAVWYSLAKKDRGTREQLAQRLGISRQVTYQWEERHTYPLGEAVLTIRDLGRMVRMQRVGQWVPDIERRLLLNATRADANAALIALALKYAGEITDEVTLHLQGKDDGPVEIIRRADELSDDELAAIAARSGPRTVSPAASA